VPDGAETVSTDEFEPPVERMTLDAPKLAAGPVGDTVADSCTIALKPLALEMVSLELPEDPAGRANDPGFAEIVNPTTSRLKVAVCLSEPFVPVK
jgi:hypothetical protein